MCFDNIHAYDITPPIFGWLWPDLPFPRPDLKCECGKRELGMDEAMRLAIPGSLYYQPEKEKTNGK